MVRYCTSCSIGAGRRESRARGKAFTPAISTRDSAGPGATKLSPAPLPYQEPSRGQGELAHPSEQYGYSRTANRSPACTVALNPGTTSFTVPAFPALTTVSIFIASSVING